MSAICLEAVDDAVHLRSEGPLDGVGTAMLEVLVSSLLARGERDLRVDLASAAIDPGTTAVVQRLRRNAATVGARLTAAYGNSSASAA